MTAEGARCYKRAFMKIPPFIARGLAASFAFFCTALHAQLDLFNNPAAKSKPSGSMHESYTDGAIVVTDIGDPTDPTDNMRVAKQTGAYSLSATLTVPLDGFDLATLSETSTFSVKIGDSEISGSFGAPDAGSFARKSVIFYFDTEENPDTGRITVHGHCTVAWSAARVTVTVSDSLSGEAGFGHALIIAGGLVESPSGTVPLELTFGDATGSRLVHFKGSGRTTHKTIGPVDEPLFDGDLYTGSAMGALDFVPPTVAVIAPVNNYVSPRSSVPITVKTNEPGNLGPSTVTVNGGTPQPLEEYFGTGYLTGEVGLPLPENTLVFQVQDMEGNAARPMTVKVFYKPLAASWLGTVTRAGSTALSGTVLVTSTKDGVFTGKLLLGGGAYSFKGVFSPAGVASVAIVGKVGWHLDLALDLTGGTLNITGTLQAGAESAAVAASRSTWSKENLFASNDIKVVASAGDESVGAPPAGTPEGFSWATGLLGKLGTIKLAGKLADGSSFSASGLLDDDNGVALLFTGTPKGTYALCTGTVTVSDDPDTGDSSGEFTGTLDWRRAVGGTAPFAAGFAVLHPTHGATFLPGFRVVFRDPDPTVPPTIEEDTPFGAVGDLVFSAAGGGIEALTHTVTLAGPAKATPVLPNPRKLSLVVNNSTGAVTGSFLSATTAGKVLPFTGVALPGVGLRGLALSSGGSVRVLINVEP